MRFTETIKKSVTILEHPLLRTVKTPGIPTAYSLGDLPARI